MRFLPAALAIVASGAVPAAAAFAQVRVNPTGVSVNAMGPTTVFLTFGGVRAGLRPAEAFWCGELVSAAPDRGNRCNPTTIFGQLPARYNLSRTSGTAGLTDIMSIPASVARRAYQDAVRGAVSSFFYVRRFEDVAGGQDEFVAVTCRLTSGGARTPFALTDVRVHFGGGDEVQFVQAGTEVPPFTAQIVHNGTGRLVGRWEVVLPGEEGPSSEDLLTEATLPVESRQLQRKFAQVQRFNVFVPPGGKVTLPGPDPARLPTSAEGSYMVLLRIEATDDREGDSDLGAAGAGSGLIHSGAVAGFPMPVLRYVVLGDGSVTSRDGASRLTQLAPRDGASARADSTFRLVWGGHRETAYYRLELETPGGERLLSAITPRTVVHYEVPAMTWARATGGVLRWRVTALDDRGVPLRRTGWRRVTAGGTLGAPPPVSEPSRP